MKDTTATLSELDQAFLYAAAKEFDIQTAEGPKKIIATDFLASNVFKKAMSGSTHAQGQFMDRVEKATLAEQQIAENNLAYGNKVKAYFTSKLVKFIEAGGDEKNFVPHPDGIIVNEETGYKIIGPFDDVSLKQTF